MTFCAFTWRLKSLIKGSEVIPGWQPVTNRVWKVTLPNVFFGGYHPASTTPVAGQEYQLQYTTDLPSATVAKAEAAANWRSEAICLIRALHEQDRTLAGQSGSDEAMLTDLLRRAA